MDNIDWKERIDDILIKKKKYRDPDYSAGQLAEELGVSIYQLARILKKTYGKSYAEIILPMRIKDARRHLRNPKKDYLMVEEIGILVGFKNKWSFFQAYKKYAGGTPGEIRKDITKTI